MASSGHKACFIIMSGECWFEGGVDPPKGVTVTDSPSLGELVSLLTGIQDPRTVKDYY